MKILLLEDDPVLGSIIVDYLQQYYNTQWAFDAAEVIGYLDKEPYDLFIFDINVPGKSGIELLKELREFNTTTPAIIITAYTDTENLKKSFDAGAHDLLRKPFELEELHLRIERSKSLFHIKQDAPIELDRAVTYYPQKNTIDNADREVKLKPKECEILDYFIANPNRVISQEELMQNIWEFDTMPSDATLRSYIRNLREAIGAKKITTQRGLGYRYEHS